MPNPQRTVDILHLAEAQVLKREVRAITDLFVHGLRDAEAAGLCQAFKACGDIDAVAVDIVAVDHHVAEVDPGAELDSPVVRQDGVPLGQPHLYRGGGAHRANDACELHQNAVAHQLDDPALMLAECGIDQFGSQGLESRERALLVSPDQPRVADHVGGQDRCKTALHRVLPSRRPPDGQVGYFDVSRHTPSQSRGGSAFSIAQRSI